MSQQTKLPAYPPVEPLFYLEFVEIESKSIKLRGFEIARTQEEGGGPLRSKKITRTQKIITVCGQTTQLLKK